jgi:hypothetical protein
LRRLRWCRSPAPPQDGHDHQQADRASGERSREEPLSAALSCDDKIRRSKSELVDRLEPLDHIDRLRGDTRRDGRRPALQRPGFGRSSRLDRRRLPGRDGGPRADVIQRNDPEILDDLLRWRRLLEPYKLELLDRGPRDAAVALTVCVSDRK